MAYEINIRGLRDPIRSETNSIREVWEKYIETKVDQVVQLGDWTGKLSEIKWLKKIEGSKSGYSGGERSDIEYRKDLTEKRAQTASVRAQNLGLFRLMYWGFTGKKSEEVLVKGESIEKFAEKIQQKFFEENPKKIVCDPRLFKPLIKSDKCDATVVSIIEGIVRQDAFAEKYL